MNPRYLRSEEVVLITDIITDKEKYPALISMLDRSKVVDMNDGGMGSVKFVYDSDTLAIFGTEIASALYCDTDGVPVSITVNLDQAGRFFELDIWKVDFSPLQRFPRPQDRLTES